MAKIVKWITYEEAKAYEKNDLGGMGGWFGVDPSKTEDERWNAGHRWKDYLDIYEEGFHPMLEELRRSILENKIRCTGDDHQYKAVAVPLWDDNKVSTWSYRAWGDLMAAVYSEAENKNYNYMDFYM